MPRGVYRRQPEGYIGKIREADGGVLFLDEIGDMPAGLQTRLLRVLQEKRSRRSAAAALIRSISRWSAPRTTICLGRYRRGVS